MTAKIAFACRAKQVGSAFDAGIGLGADWLKTQKWPDCIETVPYDFRAECEKYRDYPKDMFFA